jgi:uncharacterized protein YehS (DUF1456 family)
LARVFLKEEEEEHFNRWSDSEMHAALHGHEVRPSGQSKSSCLQRVKKKEEEEHFRSVE